MRSQVLVLSNALDTRCLNHKFILKLDALGGLVSENSSDQNQPHENNTATPPNESVASELEALKAQVEKFKNDYLYLRAEFDNYRRNMIKERSDLVKYGAERILVDILGIMDNFERAMENRPTPESLNNFVKGIEMTQSEFRSALQKHGVSEVPSLGVAFDPMVHEALSSEETVDYKPGHIARVFKKPYKLHDKVIRPGQVVVAREPSK
jgi:molecular chaperone GrpE